MLARSDLRRLLVDARFAAGAARLPPRVARFQVRAHRMARRTGDAFSLSSATRPADLRTLLGVARGRHRVVELGTATGWTAISLALADPRRTVLSCDIVEREEPQRYLGLISADARARIELAVRSGSDGPAGAGPVDLLYIDSSHERAQTIEEVRAWRPVLAPGTVIVFDDYTHPDFPGVSQAVAELGLSGDQRGTLFVHHISSSK